MRRAPLPLLFAATVVACTVAYARASHIDEFYLRHDSDTFQSKCNGFLASHFSSELTLKSPNYPDHYPNGTRCVRLLRAPTSRQRIVLRFVAFDVERSRKCTYDSLVLKDGPYGFSPEIARLCGHELPGPVRSSGQFMLVIFSTDEYVRQRGFLATFEFETIPIGEGAWLGDPCYIDVTLTGNQGATVIDRGAVMSHYSNYSGELAAVDCVWDIRSPNPSGLILMWTYKVYQLPVSVCNDRVIQIYATKLAAKLFDIDTPMISSCYHGEDRVYPGSNRLLLHINTKSMDFLPRIEFNHTIYTSALQNGMCPEGLFDCEDGKICLDFSLKCNGYENCPNGLDESKKHCTKKQIHENKWLQLIFLMAALCGAIFVTAALWCSATEQMRQRRSASKRASASGSSAQLAADGGDSRGGSAAEEEVEDESAVQSDACHAGSGCSPQCGFVKAPLPKGTEACFDGHSGSEGTPAEAAEKRRALFSVGLTAASVDSSHHA